MRLAGDPETGTDGDSQGVETMQIDVAIVETTAAIVPFGLLQFPIARSVGLLVDQRRDRPPS